MCEIVSMRFALALAAFAGGMMAVAGVLKLHEKGIHPLRNVMQIVRRPWIEIALLLFCNS